MATYVIGDIHGCFDEFMEMLRIIDYDDEDEIICVGDYIDRGPKSYEMLKWMENQPENVLLIKGNHDVEYTANIEIMKSFNERLELNSDDNVDTRTLYLAMQQISAVKEAYFDYYLSLRELIFEKNVSLKQLILWADMINNMPYMYKKMVNGRKCVMVHAGYKPNDPDFNIYAREEAYTDAYVEHGMIIAGHTPTVIKTKFAFTGGKIYRKYSEKYDCIYYDIDCGCVYRSKYPEGRLACIRLEDEELFYV